MNHRSRESFLHRSLPLLSFGVAILLVILTGPSFRGLARSSGGTTQGLIKVTHIVFNHKFATRSQGPQTTDALSIRTNWDSPLAHGPFDPSETAPAEAGAGEWIVNPAADGTQSARNNAALYLRETEQHAGSTIIMVRFEATNVSDAQIFATPVGVWPSLPPVTVSFDNKIPGSELNKYSGLDERSVGGNPDSYTVASHKTSQDYITFTWSGKFPDSVNRTTPTFAWFAQNVHLKDGTTVDSMTLNVSGLPNPNDNPSVSGHELFTVLETPQLPWYDTDEHTDPWVIGLRDVTDPKAAQGQTTLPDAGSKLATYLFGSKGFKYDTSHGAPRYARLRGTAATDKLQDYILVKNPTVNCYDQAGGLASYMNLVGAKAQFRYRAPFGYINTVGLVGVGPCNNPFGRPTVVPASDPNRTPFGNHAYCLFEDKVYDACAGPQTGSLTEKEYWSAVVDLVRSRFNLQKKSDLFELKIVKQ